MGERTTHETDDLSTVAGELRVVLGSLSRRMREQGSIGDLTRSQTAVLIRLEKHGPATMSALARAEGVRPQSMGTTVSVLESAGFVARTQDPDDGRKTVLSLTDWAREQFTTGRLAREDWLSRVMRSQLTAAEQEKLADCIHLLQRLASSP